MDMSYFFYSYGWSFHRPSFQHTDNLWLISFHFVKNFPIDVNYCLIFAKFEIGEMYGIRMLRFHKIDVNYEKIKLNFSYFSVFKPQYFDNVSGGGWPLIGILRLCSFSSYTSHRFLISLNFQPDHLNSGRK